MAFYTTVHLHNVLKGNDAECGAWFNSAHCTDPTRLSGFEEADWHEVTPEQIVPDIPQPRRYASSIWPSEIAPGGDLSAYKNKNPT